MQQKKQQQVNASQGKRMEILYSFRIILKFWKKESIHEDISLKEAECNTINNFITAIKERYSIKNAHCLEEIWLIQQRKNYEPELTWIPHVHGRIKLEVPQKYKDFLVRKANKDGIKPYEDPKF